MQNPIPSSLNHTEQLTFTKILTQQSLFHEIWAQLKQEQRQLFVMCQSNKDYQIWKEKFKTRFLQRNIITYFALIPALKNILTATNKYAQNSHSYHNPASFSHQNSSILKTTNIANPYSHLLCFRLLKQALLKVDYGLLILVQTQLVNLMFNVSIFDSGSQDEQRGRSMYLQGLTSSTIDNNLPMTHQQLEVIGYSVHKIVLEILMTLGMGLPIIPYHPVPSVKQSLKSDQSFLTDRLLTPRTVGSTFTNEFERQKMKLLTQQVKKYPSNILSSLSTKLYTKTKKMNVKYPQKLHYFKLKEMEKFKKEVVFNSEQKQYHILKFYEFLIAFVIREQVDINQKLLQKVKVKSQVEFSKFRQQILHQNGHSFKLILKNIMQTNDRFALYFTIFYLTKSLKILEPDHKSKPNFSKQYQLITFFSISEIIEYLTLTISTKVDKTQGLSFLELNRFNLEMFLAVDQILSSFLFNAYLSLFDNNNINESFFYQYAKNYFYNIILKLEKVRSVLIVSTEKHLKKQFKEYPLQSYLAQKQTLLTSLSSVLLKFYVDKTFPDQIQKMTVSKSQKNYLQRFQSVKSLFQVSIQCIQYTGTQISLEAVQNIKKKIQLIKSLDLINLAATKFSVSQSTDDTSITYQKHQFMTEKFQYNLQQHQKSSKSKSNAEINKELPITVLNVDNRKDKSQIQTSQIKCEQLDSDDDQIPMQSSTRPKSFDTYQFKLNPNDISKLNLNKTTLQNKFYNTSDKKFIKKPSQLTKLSFKQSLQNGTSRLNLMNRDTETLRSLSRRKYKRRNTKSRAQMLQLSSESLDQAMSCPTFIGENSQFLQLGQTFEQVPSDKNIPRNSKDFQRIMALEKQIQDSRKQQQKLMGKIKKQEQTISSLLSNDKKKYSFPRRITGMPPLQQGKDVFCIKDSISKKVHTINVGGQSVSQIQDETQKTGNTQKRKMLNIKDTQSYETIVKQVTPNHNRTKLKSRFNESNDDSLNNLVTKFDSTDKKISPGGSALKKELTTPDKFWKGKEFSVTDSDKINLHYFNFPIKIKKDLLKKKVLIIKDQLIEIGMITQFERLVPSAKNLNLVQDKKNKKQFNDFKLKSSLYITPLTNLSKIQLDIKDTLWLEHDFLTNKVKHNLKADSQYISYVDFRLLEVENNKNFNYLPDLEVKIQIQDSTTSKSSQGDSKVYKFSLPLFVNKFFIEEGIDELEIKQIEKIISSTNDTEIEVSSKLVKEAKDLEKYFSKLISLKVSNNSSENIMATKVKFLNQHIYLCFGKQFGHVNKLLQGKSNQKCLNLKIISETQLKYPTKKIINHGKLNQILSNLLIRSVVSLLTE